MYLGSQIQYFETKIKARLFIKRYSLKEKEKMNSVYVIGIPKQAKTKTWQLIHEENIIENGWWTMGDMYTKLAYFYLKYYDK